MINGGQRVPGGRLPERGRVRGVPATASGPCRSTARLAADQLGPACPTGLVPPADEALQTIAAEWLAEFERVHLILRLSPRLRARHGD